jgi:hypothetical protein
MELSDVRRISQWMRENYRMVRVNVGELEAGGVGAELRRALLGEVLRRATFGRQRWNVRWLAIGQTTEPGSTG